MAAGRPVFAKHCASCHTIEGRVAHPTFIESPIPNLDEVRPRRKYIEERVESGGFDMASFSGELSEAEFAAVVAYVVGVAGSRVVDTGAESPTRSRSGSRSSATTASAATGSAGAEPPAGRSTRGPTSTTSSRASGS